MTTRCPSHDWDAYLNQQEGPEECPVCGRPNYDEDKDEPVCEEEPDFCSVACARKYDKGAYAVVSFDDAKYVGSLDDGVYYQAAEGPDGWYVSAVVDCNTSGFCEALVTDDGPFSTEEKAMTAGYRLGEDWCMDNQVPFD